MADIDRREVIDLLNRILEQELAGVVRYTHYSFLVFGYNRIPIVSWLREQASESLLHAQQAGEMIHAARGLSLARDRAASRQPQA
jgi:bacterioferritin